MPQRPILRRTALLAALPALVLAGTAEARADDAAAGPSPYRKMFVTSTAGTGDLSSWDENTTPPSGLTGVAAGDEICQVRAEAAGLATEGTPIFRAWLSDGTTDAWCHVQGLTGSRFGGSPCDSATLIGGGPWVRVDGIVFSLDLDQLVNSSPIHEASLDETGATVPATSPWTGSYEFGHAHASRCGDWTVGDSGVGGIGRTYNVGQWSSGGGTLGCETSQRLYCFEQGSGPAPPGPEPAAGALAFVTSKTGPGNFEAAAWLPESDGLSGVAAADAVCRNLAADASLPSPEGFVAWVSSSTSNAVDRLTGDGPWKALDGWPVAASKADLTDASIETAIRLNEDGISAANSYYWTGSVADGTYDESLSDTCQDWTVSVTGSGTGGAAGETAHTWTTGIGTPCSFNDHLLCLGTVVVLGWDNFETGDLSRWSMVSSGAP